MFLLVGGVVMLLVSNVLCLRRWNENANGRFQDDHVTPASYDEVLKAAESGKLTIDFLGQAGIVGTTCGARDGKCVDAKQCPGIRVDIGATDCSWHSKVCCKITSSVGRAMDTNKRDTIPLLSDLDELGTPLEIIAMSNSMLLSNQLFHKSGNDTSTYLSD